MGLISSAVEIASLRELRNKHRAVGQSSLPCFLSVRPNLFQRLISSNYFCFTCSVEVLSEMGGACGRQGIYEKCTQILVGKLERKKRRRWEDMDLKGTGCGLYYQAQDMDQWRVLVTTVSGCIRGG
jgi:hypothetical protein